LDVCHVISNIASKGRQFE